MNKYLWKPSKEKVENSLLEDFSKFVNFNTNKNFSDFWKASLVGVLLNPFSKCTS